MKRKIRLKINFEKIFATHTLIINFNARRMDRRRISSDQMIKIDGRFEIIPDISTF